MEILRDVKYEYIKEKRRFLYNVGSGGTRYHVSTQNLRTAGFMIKINSTTLYVDPGTSALVSCLERGVDLASIDAVFISHAHVDHYGDGEAMIESIYLHSQKSKKPVLITTPCVLGDRVDCERKISVYHQKITSKIYCVSPKDTLIMNDMHFTFTPTIHHEVHNIGFVLSSDGKRIGYVSDSVYFSNFDDFFRGVDMLIVHPVVLSRTPSSLYRHASMQDVIEMVISSQPKYVVLRHIGYEILSYGVDKFSKEIERETGIPVRYLLDGDALLF